MRFWLRFGASRGHEIFMESKCKACYTTENFLLSIDVYFFFFMEFSDFTPGLALPAMCNVGCWSNSATIRDQLWMDVAARG